MKNTVVQENGKVVAEGDDMNQQFHLPMDYFDVKNNRPLRLRKKLYEFYTAPITKFWGHSVSDSDILLNGVCFIDVIHVILLKPLTEYTFVAVLITIKCIWFVVTGLSI